MAGLAAGLAASAATARGQPEQALLAGRLTAEGRWLRGLDWNRKAMQSGAQRAAELRRTLRAAGLATTDLEALLSVAVSGLGAAVAI